MQVQNFHCISKLTFSWKFHLFSSLPWGSFIPKPAFCFYSLPQQHICSFTHFSFPTFTLQGPRGRDLHLESSQSSLLVKGLRPNIVKGWDCWGKRRIFKHLKIGPLTKESFQLCRLEFGHGKFLQLLTFIFSYLFMLFIIILFIIWFIIYMIYNYFIIHLYLFIYSL